MRILFITICLFCYTSCSYVLDFEDDINQDYEYQNILAKFDTNAQSDWSQVLEQDLQPTAIMLDSEENLVIVGHYWGSPEMGSGSLEPADYMGLFITKLNPSGEHMWSKGFSAVHSEAIALSDLTAHMTNFVLDESDNIIITGSFSTDMLDFGDGPLPYSSSTGQPDGYLAKFDPDGNYLFARGFGAIDQENEDEDSREYGWTVGVDAELNIFMVGSTDTSIDIGDEQEVNGAFLVSFDPDGNTLWAKDLVLETGYFELSVSSTGNILISGAHWGEIDLGGGPIGSELTEYDVGVFAVLFSNEGTHIWSTSFGDNGSFSGFPGTAATFDNDDNMIVVGTEHVESTVQEFESSYRVFLSKFSPSGEETWISYIDFDILYYGSNTELDSLIVDSDNNIILTGLFNGPISVGDGPTIGAEDDGNEEDGDAFIMKFDDNGDHLWGLALERAIPVNPLQSMGYSMVTTAAAVNSSNNIYFVSGSPISNW